MRKIPRLSSKIPFMTWELVGKQQIEPDIIFGSSSTSPFPGPFLHIISWESKVQFYMGFQKVSCFQPLQNICVGPASQYLLVPSVDIGSKWSQCYVDTCRSMEVCLTPSIPVWFLPQTWLRLLNLSFCLGKYFLTKSSSVSVSSPRTALCTLFALLLIALDHIFLSLQRFYTEVGTFQFSVNMQFTWN